MAHSLLAHLYSRIRGSQEDVATISLQYLLSQSEELNIAFTKMISTRMEIALDDKLQYTCQAVGQENERPDMAATDKNGDETILCEMKFYAGLTPNQPLNYLKRLKENSGKGLVFVCPKTRQISLWTKLKELCVGQSIEVVNERCIRVNGVCMAILTWGEILEQLHAVAAFSAVEYISDIQQLDGYCKQMDSDAFIPFSPEELTANNAKLIDRYYEVVDKTVDLICADEKLGASIKGKAISYKFGYEKKVSIGDYVISIAYDRALWKTNSSVETPFWGMIADNDWKQPDNIQRVLKRIDETKKEDTVWSNCYLALETLTDATLEEVCLHLKKQMTNYLDLFD